MAKADTAAKAAAAGTESAPVEGTLVIPFNGRDIKLPPDDKGRYRMFVSWSKKAHDAGFDPVTMLASAAGALKLASTGRVAVTGILRSEWIAADEKPAGREKVARMPRNVANIALRALTEALNDPNRMARLNELGGLIDGARAAKDDAAVAAYTAEILSLTGIPASTASA